MGDSIRIKYGTLDPDFEKYDMGGWQGRIIEIDNIDGINFEIELDSITLKQIPRRYIMDSLRDGADYAIMYVNSIDVEKIEPRDTEDEVKAVRQALNKELNYVSVLDEDNSSEKLETLNVLLDIKNRIIRNEDLKNPSLN